MEEPLLPRSPFRRYLPAVSLLAVLIWQSFFATHPPKGPDIEYFDKIAHFFVFGFLATLWFRAIGVNQLDRKIAALALALTLFNAMSDEWFQSMNAVRSADWHDWVADGLGAVTAILCYRYWRWYRRLLETRLWGKIRTKA